MKHLKRYVIVVSLGLNGSVFAIDCAALNPQGPDAVISCAATAAGFASAEAFWNQKLFSPVTLDGYCQSSPQNLDTAQTTLFQQSCTQQKGTYFSYAQFIAADAALFAKFGAVSPNPYRFMRNNSWEVNVSELTNFLATAAQETTGNGLLPDKYEQDGLYFRSEYSYLAANSCYTYPANPNYTGSGKGTGTNCGTTPLASYLTNYYPVSTYAVAVCSGTSPDNYQIYTGFVMDQDGQYNLNTANGIVTVQFNGVPTGPNVTYAGGTYAMPASVNTACGTTATWQYMNQTIDQGYWIGQGNLQLTSVAMTQFFGWYYQQMATGAPVNYANFNTFVQQYLGNGQLAWIGGLWYWNFRVQGSGSPTLHQILGQSTLPACHDIGITTYQINGGCGNANERTLYYKYFKTKVFGLPTTGIPYTCTGGGTSGNSMLCSSSLNTYCTTGSC